MNLRKSKLFIVTYLSTLLLFSYEILDEIVKKSTVARNIVDGLGSNTIIDHILATLLTTAFGFLVVLVLYLIINLAIRISLAKDFSGVNNAVFNGLFMSATAATTVSVFLKLVISMRMITIFYPIMFMLVFDGVYIAQFKGARERYIPIVIVSAASLIGFYYVVTHF
ncbi:hypothetical protein [Companilactobacillus mishanensis]|uniref:Yip1 domain-containing protein n=1 Tax=Companilactobacillus mishanensis TaxID=2486008 RepID=A0ABW9P7C8_9LACO|nr:hypothetical protein [Companilactobacillus mishanensis]MQS45116.1 hypothetical protein [Companilactobacillus mishanensis]